MRIERDALFECRRSFLGLVAAAIDFRAQIQRIGRSLRAAPVALCAALTLAACGDMNRFQTAAPAASPVKPTRAVVQTPAAERSVIWT